jgi:TRAP-type C4-dicarboxylate transport system permease large subunit
MAVQFILALEQKKRRGVWLMLAVLLGSFIAFSSIIQVCTGAEAMPSPFLASLQGSFQAILNTAALPLICIIIVSAFLGTPIFLVLGGCAYLLFVRQGLPLAIIPNQAYQMLTGYSIAAIPLFALTGFLLSEDKASDRLIRLFRTLFSWFPGGLAVTAILACAFFTTFTGASGVTILALGGLLSYILINGGYGRNFTIGLLTASGSIGLLFPPSLPIIIYGVTAQISIAELFKGGILPGLTLVLAMVVMSIIYALRNGVERHSFHLKEALIAFRESIWEVLMPLIIFVGYFGISVVLVKRFAIVVVYILAIEVLVGRMQKRPSPLTLISVFVPVSATFILLFPLSTSWIGIWSVAALVVVYGLLIANWRQNHDLDRRETLSALFRFITLVAGLLLLLAVSASISLTLVESAAVAAVYVLFIQLVIRRDIKIRDLPRIIFKCLPIIGGVLIILSMANGFSYYLIDADVPVRLAAWVQATISSKYVFLLMLNIALLITGCLMDIFSAILIVVPLIIPLANLFGIHPVHLGIIFLANMELGYLTPPVGLNLFLASYRFKEPMAQVTKNTFKFLLVQLVMVLLITYVPLLTTLLLKK